VSQVTLRGAVKHYGDVVALEAFDLEVQEGEFLTLLGPSGCGKTTTLRLVAGFIDPTAGQILIDGEDVTGLPPQKRQIGMVFQDYALFPHLTIGENVGFGLKERGAPKAHIQERVEELLELVRLPGVEDRYPVELSGGQQQRVALARAVAFLPRVLLMDEPLGALDLKLREAMQYELRRIQQELKITTIYVTHDQHEAMTMSDRIAVMNLGNLIQLDGAHEIYTRPKTKFVADFVGKINFLPGQMAGEEGEWAKVEVANSTIRVPKAVGANIDGPVTVALRPEHLLVGGASNGASGNNAIKGKITDRIFAGNLLHVTVEVGDGNVLMIEAKPSDDIPGDGESVDVCWVPEHVVLLTE
jgi:spermidine/putrescine ABC transporter ATP-binding subunit